jgi:hypothetical protein
MRGVSTLWRSFAFIAMLSLIAPAAFAGRIGGPPGIAAQGRIGIPPGAPAEDEEQGRIGWPPGGPAEAEAQGRISIGPGAPAAEAQSLWSRLMTWLLWFA